MKKVLIYLLVCVFSISSCVGLTACSNKEPTYEKIVLTTQNYSQYIAINVYYSDCETLEAYRNENYTFYDLSCIGNITTSKRADCSFQEVSIKYIIKPQALWNVSPKSGNPYAELNYEGESHCSFSISSVYNSILSFPFTADFTISVQEITGYVILPK